MKIWFSHFLRIMVKQIKLFFFNEIYLLLHGYTHSVEMYGFIYVLNICTVSAYISYFN